MSCKVDALPHASVTWYPTSPTSSPSLQPAPFMPSHVPLLLGIKTDLLLRQQPRQHHHHHCQKHCHHCQKRCHHCHHYHHAKNIVIIATINIMPSHMPLLLGIKSDLLLRQQPRQHQHHHCQKHRHHCHHHHHRHHHVRRLCQHHQHCAKVQPTWDACGGQVPGLKQRNPS